MTEAGASEAGAAQAGSGGAGRILAVATVRNEAAFLLDWLAHHRAVGITDFLVFSNDCDDGTEVLLDRLQVLGQLVHVPNPGPHAEGPQWAALKAADRHPLTRAADWILVLDVDEYVNVHVGDHRLGALLAALPEATAIPLTWRMFGNGGRRRYRDVPVSAEFTRAAPPVLHWPWRAQLFKTLFRNDGTYRKLGVHRPRSPDPARLDGARWFDGSGRPLPEARRGQGIISAPGLDHYRLAQLNHYPLGAMESYLLKCDRGRANRDNPTFDMGYWTERNFDAVEDLSIAALAGPVARLRAELAGDAELARLHAAAVAWRHRRFEQLMEDEPWRTLFGQLLLAPPSRLLDPAEARLIWDRSARERERGP